MDEMNFRNQMREILEVLYPDENVNNIMESVFDVVLRYKSHRIILEKRKKYRDEISLSSIFPTKARL